MKGAAWHKVLLKRCGQDAKTRWFPTCLVFTHWQDPFIWKVSARPLKVSLLQVLRGLNAWSCLVDIIFFWWLKMPNDNGSGILNREENRLSSWRWWHVILCPETLHAQCLVADWSALFESAALVGMICNACFVSWDSPQGLWTMITSWSPFGSKNSSSQ